ncbi:MAG: PatB family C-S lyase [Bacteroidales bacterium]
MKYNFDEIIERGNTGCVKYDLLESLYGKKDLLPFWVADMDFRTPPPVAEVIEKKLRHGIYGYPVITDNFYQAIIHWLTRRHGWQAMREWIVFTPGVVPAINLAVMAYTKPGDKIIVQPPVYFPFFSAVKNNERELVFNPLREEEGRYFMDLEDLERKAGNGARILIFCHPHNPVGRAWTIDELSEVSRICKKYGLLILSDEIHADLMLHGRKHFPMASLDEETAAITVTFMAPSKSFNLAGLTSSFLVISNPSLRKNYMEILERVHIGMGNTFGLAALEAAYLGGEDWLNQLLEYLRGNLEFLLQYLRNNLPMITPVVPEATYLVWLDFRKTGMSQQAIVEFLVHKAGLALNSGGTFGPGGEGFMRMNIACPRATLEKGLRQLNSAMKSGF